MDIWIILDGEKIGPIHDFEIRRKIEAGELSATTPAWHEGLAAWKPLVEIELFTRAAEYPLGVHVLPKHLDEKVARLHVEALGAKLTKLRQVIAPAAVDRQQRHSPLDGAQHGCGDAHPQTRGALG